MTTAGRAPGGDVRVRAVVEGRVQGVWFRESCRREAERLGVVGDVRNTARGTVEMDVQGTRPAVDRLLAWARHGPPRADVRALTLEDLPPAADPPAGFRVVG